MAPADCQLHVPEAHNYCDLHLDLGGPEDSVTFNYRLNRQLSTRIRSLGHSVDDIMVAIPVYILAICQPWEKSDQCSRRHLALNK
jgi:hypothetical protein